MLNYSSEKTRKTSIMSSFLLLLWLTVLTSSSSSSSSSSPTPSSIAKSNCAEKCGSVTIPYPFGIGANCFYGPFYEILCNHSFKPPKPFLHHFNLEVTNIRWPVTNIRWPLIQNGMSDTHALTVRAPATNICRSDSPQMFVGDFTGSPYSISNLDNILRVEGCSGSVGIKNSSTGEILAGCASLCDVNVNRRNDLATCYGVGCCESSLPSTTDPVFFMETGQIYTYYDVGSELYETALDHIRHGSTNTCTLSAALIQSESEEEIRGKLHQSRTFPTLLLWRFTGSLKKGKEITCWSNGRGIQFCFCGDIYQGNPYLPNGCQLIQECQSCPHHCYQNYTGNNYYCHKTSWLKQPLVLGLSVSMGLVLVIIGCYLLYRLIKWRRELWRKAKFFKRNGGLLLQQQMSSSDGIVEKLTIFNVSELEKATDNFNENRVLGQGGQGTVYKGMLMDGRLVAIKISTKVDQGQLDQFVNEVVILSQINHRNVVKLLGCCLETEVPLLVYEFIPNGTLYQHIHEPTEEFHVSWKMRLQIAAESAGALAYLHSSSSAPIYHRDIKSSNILLDDKYRAKISDFGNSRVINIDQTHVTTRVQGTFGYLDPEYFQSNQFTDKSDVYSFGVVLVELITGQKSICHTDCGGWKSLAVKFLSQMEMSCSFDIVDAQVREEGKKEEFIVVAELATRCLNMNGKQRPTMKEVATVLDGIRSHNSMKPKSANVKCVPEISNNGSLTTDMFYTASASFSSLSIEVQPLMFDRPV